MLNYRTFTNKLYWNLIKATIHFKKCWQQNGSHLVQSPMCYWCQHQTWQVTLFSHYLQFKNMMTVSFVFVYVNITNNLLHLWAYFSACLWNMEVKMTGQYRADYRLAPSQWETLLQSNPVSHWLGTNLESALPYFTGVALERPGS